MLCTLHGPEFHSTSWFNTSLYKKSWIVGSDSGKKSLTYAYKGPLKLVERLIP